MLSLFPGILFLAPLGTTLVRIAAGLTFIYMAYAMANTRDKIEKVRVPIIGHISGWMFWVHTIVTFGAGVLLFIGLWTQAAAIIGMLLAIKHLSGVRGYAALLPLSAGAYILLFVICLSLLVTGAGPLGFDLPL